MGYNLSKSAPSLLRANYERYLYPYDIFQAGAFTGDPQPLVSQQYHFNSYTSNNQRLGSAGESDARYRRMNKNLTKAVSH